MHFSPSDRAESYGHHFIIGLSGPKLDDLDKRILNRLKPAGILLLKRNFDHTCSYSKWIETLAALIKDVKAYAERDSLIVSLDHEGGRVHRAPAPITLFPEAIKYSGHPEEVAKAMAIELKSMGVNLSWAPVADIHSNPANPIIGNRAFGSTADEVIERTVRFTQALDSHGILTCAKHYPGHGDTSTDSHLELPTLFLTESELRQRELRPFIALAKINVPFVMTAHILFPKIDPIFPVTLSWKLLRGILRDECGYKGIIVSDDLDMKAVSEAFSSADTIGLAMQAGCDMFIVARHPDPSSDRPLALAKNLYDCLRRKKVSEDLLNESFIRIKSLFDSRLSDYLPQVLPEDALSMNALLAKNLSA